MYGCFLEVGNECAYRDGIWWIHVTHICRWMLHVTHTYVDERITWHTYVDERIMWHTWMHHVTHISSVYMVFPCYLHRVLYTPKGDRSRSNVNGAHVRWILLIHFTLCCHISTPIHLKLHYMSFFSRNNSQREALVWSRYPYMSLTCPYGLVDALTCRNPYGFRV